MDELIKAMSDEELERAKGLYKDNPKIVELIDGILASRVKVVEQAKAQAKFEKGIESLGGMDHHARYPLNQGFE